MRNLSYNDLSADRPTVAAVQALEAILLEHAQGRPGASVVVNGPNGGLALLSPYATEAKVLYQPPV
jgi:hypothetical protein